MKLLADFPSGACQYDRMLPSRDDAGLFSKSTTAFHLLHRQLSCHPSILNHQLLAENHTLCEWVLCDGLVKSQDGNIALQCLHFDNHEV